MLLHQLRHRSVTTATAELSNVLLSPKAECRLDDVTSTSKLDAIVAMMIELCRHLYRSMADSVFHAPPNFQ